MGKQNYQHEKRQKDIAKKKKAEEKRQRKLAEKAGVLPTETADHASDTGAPPQGP